MTIHLPDDVANFIRAEVLSGDFTSENEVVAAAVRDYLRRKHARQATAAADTGQPVLSENEPDSQELQRRLVEAGVLSEIKEPITDLVPYRNRHPVPIQGETLSESMIREHR